jgi:hypothetical protein
MAPRSLAHTAMDLAADDERVDHHPAILDHDIA